MLKTLTLNIAPEIESLASEQNTTVEAVVYEALSEYVRSQRKAVLRERLEEEYRALGEMWPELESELDEVRWHTVENEALNKTEDALD
jgi:hypothetical protein